MLKICISGGPCSGKSSCLGKLHDELTEKLNKKVFIVPETATELIANGIFPCENISMKEFQGFVLDKQLAKEELYNRLTKYYDPKDIVILYDRGLLDQMAYVDKPFFEEMLKERGISFADIAGRYDMVIHLVTAAKGTDCYTKDNNSARRETAEEAIVSDDKTLASNLYHPHLRVVDNSTGFDEKVQRVLSIVFDALGKPHPSGIEKKILIKKPYEKDLENLKFSTVSDIYQTYLISVNNTERRVRKRGNEKDGYAYYYTEKTEISDCKRLETEKKISEGRYKQLLEEADPNLNTIFKTRYAFLYEGQYFELDLYPFDDEKAILETEIKEESQKVYFPHFLKYIKEVTTDPNFKNRNIAKTLKL